MWVSVLDKHKTSLKGDVNLLCLINLFINSSEPTPQACDMEQQFIKPQKTTQEACIYIYYHQ